MTTEDIARDLLDRNDANLTSALLAACSLLNNARSRVEDHLPDKSMDAHSLSLLWTDLHSLPEQEARACGRCGIAMAPGKALVQTFTGGAPDFPGDKLATTMSAGGPGKLIDVMKCTNCGWTVSNGGWTISK